MFRVCPSANEEIGSSSGGTESLSRATATYSGWGPVFWFIWEMIGAHAPDPMFHLGSSLVQHQHTYERHFPFTSSMHVQSLKTSLYFILSFAAILHTQRKPALCQECIVEEPSAKQSPSAKPYRFFLSNQQHVPHSTPPQKHTSPYLFLVSLDLAVLMVLPSCVISLSWEAGASLTGSGSTTVSWVTGKTSSSAPCWPKCCLA